MSDWKDMLLHDVDNEPLEPVDDGLGAFRGVVNCFVAYAVFGLALITFLAWRVW